MQVAEPSDITSKNLEIIKMYYSVFQENPNTKLYLWLLKDNALASLYDFIASQALNGNDNIIELKSPFQSSEAYPQLLLNEIAAWAEQKKNNLLKNGISTALNLPNSVNSSQQLLQVLSAVHSSFYNKELNLIIWLNPTQIQNIDEFENFLSASLIEVFPENIRWMVSYEYLKHDFLQLLSNHEKAVRMLIPELFEENPEPFEDPDGPHARFRHHFLAIGKAAINHDYSSIRSNGNEAIKIAQDQEGWEQLQVGIYLAMAEALIEEPANIDESMGLLSRALNTSNKAIELEHPNGDLMKIQALIAQGSANVYLQNFKAALDSFELAIELSKKDEHLAYFELEGLRLAAICYEHFDEFNKAWSYNNDALQAAERLDPLLRKNATLPFIGEAMLRLIQIVNKHQEEDRIHQKMIEFVGEGWEEKL